MCWEIHEPVVRAEDLWAQGQLAFLPEMLWGRRGSEDLTGLAVANN